MSLIATIILGIWVASIIATTLLAFGRTVQQNEGMATNVVAFLVSGWLVLSSLITFLYFVGIV